MNFSNFKHSELQSYKLVETSQFIGVMIYTKISEMILISAYKVVILIIIKTFNLTLFIIIILKSGLLLNGKLGNREF